MTYPRRIVFEVAVRTVSLMNMREHWSVRSRRAREQREAVQWVWLEEVISWKSRVRLPCLVTMTRIAPRELDDDNLVGALKTIRDEVARQIGIDDRDPRVAWRYAQEKSKDRYAVRVEIDTGMDPLKTRMERISVERRPPTEAHAA